MIIIEKFKNIVLLADIVTKIIGRKLLHFRKKIIYTTQK